MATNHFSQANKIKGSVYKWIFKGDVVAVKVMKGDLSASPEINIPKKISHSSVICVSLDYAYTIVILILFMSMLRMGL